MDSVSPKLCSLVCFDTSLWLLLLPRLLLLPIAEKSVLSSFNGTVASSVQQSLVEQ